MSGTPISLVRTVPLRCDAVVPLVRACLERYEGDVRDDGLTLGVDVRGTGRVSVPVALHAVYGAPRNRRFELDLAARRQAGLYPRFCGLLELTPAESDVASTAISLTGGYRVPLGALGRAIDATIARGIAATGLSSFLERLVGDLLTDVARAADAAYQAGRQQV